MLQKAAKTQRQQKKRGLLFPALRFVAVLTLIGLYCAFLTQYLKRLADPLLSTPLDHHALQASEIDLNMVKLEFNPSDREQVQKLTHKDSQVLHPLWLLDAVLAAYNVSRSYPHADTSLPAEGLMQLHQRHEDAVHNTMIADIPIQRTLLPGRETLLLMTPTHPGLPGRLLLLRRHVASIRAAMLSPHTRFWQPSFSSSDAAQLLWIVVEDHHTLDSNVAQLLLCSGLPFVYFAFGPSPSRRATWGNIQRNAAAAVAARLAQAGIAGPGWFLDDDAYVSPWFYNELLGSSSSHVSVWPVARLGPDEGSWEGPILGTGSGMVVGWHTQAEDVDIKYKTNWNGFCFNTMLLVDPAFFQAQEPVLPLAGQYAAEDAFLRRICDSWDCMAALCGDCRPVWYSAPVIPTDILWPECPHTVTGEWVGDN